MFGLFIVLLIVLSLAAILIERQYKIDQEDWDFREDKE